MTDAKADNLPAGTISSFGPYQSSLNIQVIVVSNPGPQTQIFSSPPGPVSKIFTTVTSYVQGAVLYFDSGGVTYSVSVSPNSNALYTFASPLSISNVRMSIQDRGYPDDAIHFGYESAPNNPPPPPPFDFAISSGQTSSTITAGQTASSTINLSLTSGTAQAVSVSCSGIPSSQASCKLNGSTQGIIVTPTASATLTIETGTGTAPGTYTATITGTGGGMTHSTSFTVTVNAPPAPPPQPSSFGLPQGAVVTTGFPYGNYPNYNIRFSSPGTQTQYFPAPTSQVKSVFVNVTTYVQGAVLLFMANGVQYSMSVTPNTNYLITFQDPLVVSDVKISITDRGYSDDQSNLGYIYATTTPPPFDFSISPSPSSATITAGQTATSTITVQLNSGNAQPVSLSCSGIPSSEASCKWNGNNVAIVTPPSSATVTINTGTTTDAGTYTATITATGGGITRTTSFTVTVTSPLSLPPPISLPPGASVSTGQSAPSTLNNVVFSSPGPQTKSFPSPSGQVTGIWATVTTYVKNAVLIFDVGDKVYFKSISPNSNTLITFSSPVHVTNVMIIIDDRGYSDDQGNVAYVASATKVSNGNENSNLLIDHSSYQAWDYLSGNRIVSSINYDNKLNSDVIFLSVVKDYYGNVITTSHTHPLFGESVAKAESSGTIHMLTPDIRGDISSIKVSWQAYSYLNGQLGDLLDQSLSSEEVGFSPAVGNGPITATVLNTQGVVTKSYPIKDFTFYTYKYSVIPNGDNSLSVTYHDESAFVTAPFNSPNLSQDLYVFIPADIKVNDYSSLGGNIIGTHQSQYRSMQGMWYELEIKPKICEIKLCSDITGGVRFSITNPSSGSVPIFVRSATFGDIIETNTLDQTVSSLWSYLASKMVGGSWFGPDDVAAFAASVITDYLGSEQIIFLDTGIGSTTQSSNPTTTQSSNPTTTQSSNPTTTQSTTIQPTKLGSLSVNPKSKSLEISDYTISGNNFNISLDNTGGSTVTNVIASKSGNIASWLEIPNYDGSIAVSAGEHDLPLISIKPPSGTPPGQYYGTITFTGKDVSTGNSVSDSISLTITVQSRNEWSMEWNPYPNSNPTNVGDSLTLPIKVLNRGNTIITGLNAKIDLPNGVILKEKSFWDYFCFWCSSNDILQTKSSLNSGDQWNPAWKIKAINPGEYSITMTVTSDQGIKTLSYIFRTT